MRISRFRFNMSHNLAHELERGAHSLKCISVYVIFIIFCASCTSQAANDSKQKKYQGEITGLDPTSGCGTLTGTFTKIGPLTGSFLISDPEFGSVFIPDDKSRLILNVEMVSVVWRSKFDTFAHRMSHAYAAEDRRDALNNNRRFVFGFFSDSPPRCTDFALTRNVFFVTSFGEINKD